MAASLNSGLLGRGVLGGSILGGSISSVTAADSTVTTDQATAGVRLARSYSPGTRVGFLGWGLLGLAPLGNCGYPSLPADQALAADAVTAGSRFGRSTADSALATDSWRPSTQPAHATDAASTTDAGTLATSLARVVGDPSLTTDTASTSVGLARAVADSALAADTARAGTAQSRPTTDSVLAVDAVARQMRAAAQGADSAASSDASTASLIVSRASADLALAADSGSGHIVHFGAGTDAALAQDAVQVTGQHWARPTLDTVRTDDTARWGGQALSGVAADASTTNDAASGGGPRALDVAVTFDGAQSGIPRPFTFDAAYATDVATGGTPHVAPRAEDRALALDQAAGVVHRAPPPDIPGGQTPLFLTRISTGWPSRAPLTAAALRDRLERMERDLLRLQSNRFSVGPQPNQHDVAVHALSNAAAMGNASDQHHMAFNRDTGEYEPSGPVHSPGPVLAGVLPPGPPYGFVSRVQTGSFVGVIQGGKLQVPFVDDQGNPIPFGNGVMGLMICVGDTERNL